MRPYLVTLSVVWVMASIAAFLYSQQQNISRALLLALLPAFLAEIALYLMPGFDSARRAFDRLAKPSMRALLLAASAVLPYLLVSLRTGTFQPLSFLLLLVITSVAAFWYAILKPSPVVDILFLAFMATVYLSPVFKQIYVRPTPHLQLEILGKLMWVRLGIMAVLSLRGIENVRLGFLPTSKEWRIGIQQFLLFLPIGALASYLLQFAPFHPLPLVWWKFALFVPVMFCGVLWVVALGEEFFFRGFLQPLLSRGLHSETAGVVAASALFGSVHLPYRYFPNWRFALLAGLAGLFYGFAFLKTRSVRASMVTHALTVTVWRSLFNG